jgi:type IV pilus assembly protein PilC
MSVTQQLEAVVPEQWNGEPAPKAKKSILQFEITKRKVPRKELMHFSRQLAVFIKAGIPILDALETIEAESGNKFFKEVLRDTVERLQEGATFSEAASHHEAAFPAYYLGILKSAEMTGRLDTALLQLATYIEREVEARSKVTSALTYPAVIVAMSIVVVVVLVSFVLPRFQTFFEGLNAELPLPTRILLGVAAFVTDHWLVIVAALCGLLLGLLVALRTEAGKRLRDRMLLRVPALGDVLRHAVLERFCRILGSMMYAGVPLPDALRVTADATSNHVFRTGLEEARDAMLRGDGLAGPLAETGLFPASARQMFRVGEDTGTLDEQLETAADYFERELDYKIKRFTSLFEPAVLVVVGLIVGFVAIALVSAMYGIFNQVNTI